MDYIIDTVNECMLIIYLNLKNLKLMDFLLLNHLECDQL